MLQAIGPVGIHIRAMGYDSALSVAKSLLCGLEGVQVSIGCIILTFYLVERFPGPWVWRASDPYSLPAPTQVKYSIVLHPQA